MKTKIKVVRMEGNCWGDPIAFSPIYIGYLIDERGFYNLDNEIKLFYYLVKEDSWQSYLNIFDYDSGELIGTYSKDSGYMKAEFPLNYKEMKDDLDKLKELGIISK